MKLEDALHRHAKRSERRFASAFIESMHDTAERVSEEAIIDAYRRGSFGWRILEPAIDAAVLVKQEAVPESAARRAYAEVMSGAAHVSLPINLADLGLSGMGFRFDLINPAVEKAAAQQAARLIREVNAATKAGLRELFTYGARTGLSPYTLSHDVQAAVGLHSRQVKALINFRKALEELMSGQRRSIDAVRNRWSLAPTRIPKTLNPDRIDRLVGQYAERQLRYRANMIARTETLRATNLGQEEVWVEMQRMGVLRASAQKEWVVTYDNRLCEMCAPMDGKRVLIRGQFRSDERGILAKDRKALPTSKQVTTRTPPLHPHCRCTLRLVKRQRQYGPQAA